MFTDSEIIQYFTILFLVGLFNTLFNYSNLYYLSKHNDRLNSIEDTMLGVEASDVSENSDDKDL